MVPALVQSVITGLPNSCPVGKNPWQDMWYKQNLLKATEGKYKGRHGGAQVEAGRRDRQNVSAFQVLVKPRLSKGRGRMSRFPFNN
jgi:hypothetical protein